jgi:hypothetical protein
LALPPGPLACKTSLTSFVFYRAQCGRCHFSALENLNRGSAVVFSASRLTQAGSILPPNRIEVTVHRAFEQNPTAQVSGNGSCNSTDEQMHEKSSEKQSTWGLGEDVIERVM